MRFCLALAVAGLLLVTASANAVQTAQYGWEDGFGTILGSYGNLVDPTNVTGPQTGSQGPTLPDYTCPGAFEGDRYLHVAEDTHYSTPQAYVAWIKGLVVGDVVNASFWGFDLTPGGSPSWRLWAHYADDTDIGSYYGSASGPADYTDGTGWSQLSGEWTFAATDPLATAIIIEARLYSTPSTADPGHTDYWMDDIEVSAPDAATIVFAPEPASLALLGLGALALLRRR